MIKKIVACKERRIIKLKLGSGVQGRRTQWIAIEFINWILCGRIKGLNSSI